MRYGVVLVFFFLGSMLLTAMGKSPPPLGYDRIVAFGDSFTDDGSGDGYGFTRKSNGYVWVEYLAQMLNASLENRSWAGAKSGTGNAAGFEDWSGLLWQIEEYEPSGKLDTTLFTILAGTNDIWDGSDKTQLVIDNLLTALNSLASKGAVSILVANLPDISLAPAYIKEYAEAKEGAHMATEAINARLVEVLFGEDGFARVHHNIRVMFADFNAPFVELVEKKAFKNMTEPWYGTYTYPSPNGYMWWDQWHPMSEVHRIWANAAMRGLNKRR